MKTKPGSIALGVLSALAVVGCSTTTTVKLTGSPNAQVNGRFRAGHVSSDFSGTAAWQMELGSRQLEAFEFRKVAAEHTVGLEIRRGRTLLVQATAEPGTLGLRVHPEEGWKVETIK